jgi:uncharacterized protein
MTKIRSTRSNRVRDRRRSGSAGSFPGLGRSGRRGGIPIPTGKAAGGGIVGLLVLAAVILIPQLLGDSTSNSGSPIAGAPTADDGATVACETELERVVCGAVDDVSLYWDQQFPVSFNGTFQGTDTVFFAGATSTGCGQASAQVGPFYCPVDQLVYFDLDFLQQLQNEFGATGDLAAQYIVAHEYGHHVQNVTGISDRLRAVQAQYPDAANGLSVALELQADCFAGAWAASIAERDLFDRAGEIDEALNAASAVGDDRIMESAGREVDPDSFTHGSAEQRRRWFERGFESADPASCTTFDGAMAP